MSPSEDASTESLSAPLVPSTNSKGSDTQTARPRGPSSHRWDSEDIPDPPATSESADSPGPSPSSLIFTGSAREYFGIWIVNVCLTILTLGIYSAWAKVRKKQYFYKNTMLFGAPFEYLAEPVKILKGRLIVAALFAVYVIMTTVAPATDLVFPFVFLALLPWVFVRSVTFRMRNSAYRNIRFTFDATYRDAAAVFVWMALGVGATFGLMYPSFAHHRVELTVNHSGYGRERFSFGAPIGAFYRMYCRAVLLAIGLGGVAFMALFGFGVAGGAFDSDNPPGWIIFFTLLLFGLVYLCVSSYLKTATTNVMWSNTSLGDNRFVSVLETSQVLWLYLSNALAIIASFGLLIPWATVRVIRYRLDNIEVWSVGRADDFIADAQPDVSAAGEEVGEFLDFDFGL